MKGTKIKQTMKTKPLITSLCFAVYLFSFDPNESKAQKTNHQTNPQEKSFSEEITYPTGITYPKLTQETCSDEYIRSHPELYKAVEYGIYQLLKKDGITPKELEKAITETKTGNFKDFDAIYTLIKPKALSHFMSACIRVLRLNP